MKSCKSTSANPAEDEAGENNPIVLNLNDPSYLASLHRVEGAAGRGAPDLDLAIGDGAGRLVACILGQGDTDRRTRCRACQGEHHQVRTGVLEEEIRSATGREDRLGRAPGGDAESGGRNHGNACSLGVDIRGAHAERIERGKIHLKVDRILDMEDGRLGLSSISYLLSPIFYLLSSISAYRFSR